MLIGYSTPLSGNNRISRQNAKKDSEAFRTVINKLDLIYMNAAPTTAEFAYFSNIYEIFYIYMSK